MNQLWVWSTAIQTTSLVMIAVFFAVLSRSVRLAPVRIWVGAWLCNLFALLVTVAYWYSQASVDGLIRASYMGFKAAFVLLLIQGAWALKRPGARLVPARYLTARHSRATPRSAPRCRSSSSRSVWSSTRRWASCCSVGGVLVDARPRDHGLGWLSAGLFIRGGLALVEAAAYATTLLPAGTIDPAAVDRAEAFLSVHSSLDSGVEWLLALGCVIAVSEKLQRELRQANEDLLAAQADLRRLADRDPLTALANRRALPEVLRAVQPHGALLLFFDLDGFKQINDSLGHHVGDLCLKRFADALRECFRPSDFVVRYAGDEFVVVAPGLQEDGIGDRLARLRSLLKDAGDQGPEISFSVGTAPLVPGGHPDEALRAADEAMYAVRATRRAY